MNGPQRQQDVTERLVTIIERQIHEATSVRSVWLIYSAATIPTTASPAQRDEYERAFYAGASAVFDLCVKVGDPNCDEETGMRRIDAIRRELAGFVLDLRHGRTT